MGLINRLAVPSTHAAVAGASPLLDNDDLRPTPAEKRTWGFFEFNVFWFAATSNVSNFLAGSSYLTFGLSFWTGVMCSFAGTVIISVFMALNGRAGAVYHIGYPVYARSSFGVFGAMWPVINRSFMAIMWNGVNSVNGAQCVYVMIHAMAPGFATLPNHMSASSALNTAGMICLVIFVAATGATLMLPVHRWPLLFHIKMAVFVISSVGMLALGCTLAGGVGPVVTRKSTTHGATQSWQITRFIFTSVASSSTFASNAADWQRNARKPSDPILGQIISYPVANFIVHVVGMLVASTSQGVYGKLYWNPVTYLDQILTDNYTAKYRAAAFFISAGFSYSLLFSCVVENVYPCGNDIASLCPKFISIRRGFFLCLAGTFVINPWYLLGSASIFITVVSSYQIFLFSIIGVLLVDYFLIAKGQIDIDQLFISDRHGKYFYWNGINLRAILAYFVGIAPNFAGFLNNFGVIKHPSIGLTRSYYFAPITTTFASGVTYYLLARFYPQMNSNIGSSFKEPKGVWEPEDGQLGQSTTFSEEDDKLKESDARVSVEPVKELY